jgi:hypothetical protein
VDKPKTKTPHLSKCFTASNMKDKYAYLSLSLLGFVEYLKVESSISAYFINPATVLFSPCVSKICKYFSVEYEGFISLLRIFVIAQHTI